MTKTSEELREASHVACDKMREDLERLRNGLTFQQIRTAELDELIELLQSQAQCTSPSRHAPSFP